MSTTPVFSGTDRVDGSVPAALAQQLEGKTPQEQQSIILRYYQNEVKTVKDAAASAIARASSGGVPPPPNPPPITRATLPTQQQFFNDPAQAVRAMQEGLVTKEEFNAQTASFRQLAIQAAERFASEGKKYWNKYLAEIKAVMAGCDPGTQADPQAWTIAYNNIIGVHYSELETEAVAASRVSASEPPQGPPTPPPTPADLSKMFVRDNPKKTALTVCEGLSVAPETYIKSMESIDKGAPLGLTLDNRTAR